MSKYTVAAALLFSNRWIVRWTNILLKADQLIAWAQSPVTQLRFPFPVSLLVVLSKVIGL
jgi:hypothetical protein